MHPESRKALDAYFAQLARINGVDSVEKQFAATPSVQQTLETKIQESSAFLSRINVIGVREMKGEKIGLDVSSPIASRTNTTSSDRQTRDVSALDDRGYECKQTNYDTHLRYARIDAWAKFPDFQTRVRDVIVKRQALDRMMVGFHGASAADDTNLVTNPLLQDVNIGWLKHIENDAIARVLSGGATPGAIEVGDSGDYENLDALVYDAIQLLDPWYRDDPNLVAVMGRKLMHDKYFPLVNDNSKPTETLAADYIISQKRIGGLPAATVPFFPDDSVLITSPDNLSIYYQIGGRRRHIEDNPKRDRIENYESSNDAYVVEDYGMTALIKSIELI